MTPAMMTVRAMRGRPGRKFKTDPHHQASAAVPDGRSAPQQPARDDLGGDAAGLVQRCPREERG